MKPSKTVIKQVSMKLIDRPKAGVRMEIDPERVHELAMSIREQGLLQPIIVRRSGDRFEVVAGDRRFLAHEELGLALIRATIIDMTDEQCALARATENLTRTDLTPLEEAAVYKDLRDTQGLNPEQIGQKIGKSPGTVIRRMHILKMPVCLQKAVHHKQIAVSSAEELAVIKDIASLSYYVECAVEHGATTAVCRTWAKDWKDQQRRQGPDIGEGSEPQAQFESKPIYVTCDTCLGAMELGQEIVLRVCAGCGKAIKQAFEDKRS